MTRGTRERSNLVAESREALKCSCRSISVASSRAGMRGFVVAVRWERVLIGGNTRKDPPRLPAGVEYLGFEMKEDKPP